MLSTAIQILVFGSYIALLVGVWRVSRIPGWRIRAVVYGWAASVLWALLWSVILPLSLRGVLDHDTIHSSFPEGTLLMFFIFLGWFWPAIVVNFSRWRTRAAQERSSR